MRPAPKPSDIFILADLSHNFRHNFPILTSTPFQFF